MAAQAYRRAAGSGTLRPGGPPLLASASAGDKAL
ncbi:hypothetical protein CapIbe_014850, partial [Capra ibex]